MSAFVEVFKRKEKKYRLSAAQFDYMLRAIDGRMVLDGYGKTTVSSLYYDTPDRAIIERSLDKPLYKEKLRLRKYSGSGDGLVFVELKKKYKGIVYKRRIPMSMQAANLFIGGAGYAEACAKYPLGNPKLDSESNAYRNRQIAQEVSAFVGRYESLRPSMVIVCERSAYSPIDLDAGDLETSSDLRITFDEDIRYRDCFADSKKGEWDGYLLNPGEALMEIKATGAYPLWLTSALADCESFPSSFSKYGTAYLRCGVTHGSMAG